MNALRSSSAVARRSLATPPAPLSSTSRLISSSSFTSSLSKRSISSTSLSQRTNRVAASSRWSGSIPSSITQIRTMASETKIKVKNPVVELDGDEVWEISLLL
jgi:isocitrate dehydrogenase